uniref:Calpain catalytic domain-containing protein n=1 Tax=Apteryx owenii TaxID=8824 RepID=A0A8B9QJQ5_APTOW
MQTVPGPAQREWDEPGVCHYSLKKFKNQDFSRLRASCLSQGLLFEDDTFPAHVSSIGPNLLSEDKLRLIRWKRPPVSYASSRIIQLCWGVGEWLVTLCHFGNFS